VCNGSVEQGRENTIAVMDEKTVVKALTVPSDKCLGLDNDQGVTSLE
jgi:hypothetical protein